MRWVAASVVMLAACDLVFSLNEPGAVHDEDGDMVADAADNCPGLANDQRTEDGDEVGTACDPNPSANGDVIAFADSVFFASDFGAWTQPSAGSFAIVEDSAEPTAATEMIDATLQVVLPDSNRAALHVEVGFTVVDFGVAGNSNLFEVVIETPTNEIACGFNEDDQTSDQTTIELTNGTVVDLFDVAQINPNDSHRLVFGVDEVGGSSCTLAGESTTGSGSIAGDVTVTIRVEKMRARIAYVVLYETI